MRPHWCKIIRLETADGHRDITMKSQIAIQATSLENALVLARRIVDTCFSTARMAPGCHDTYTIRETDGRVYVVVNTTEPRDMVTALYEEGFID